MCKSLLLVVGSWIAVAGQAVQAQDSSLMPGKPVESDIVSGESHTYQITLAAEQFMRGVVEQKGVDVKLALTAPDGKPLIKSDLTGVVGLSESLSYKSTAAETYQLEVRANGSATGRDCMRQRWT